MGCVLGLYVCACCPDCCVSEEELKRRLEQRRLARLALEEAEEAARGERREDEREAYRWLCVQRFCGGEQNRRKRLMREERVASDMWPLMLKAARTGTEKGFAAAAACGDAEAVSKLAGSIPAGPPPPPPHPLHPPPEQYVGVSGGEAPPPSAVAEVPPSPARSAVVAAAAGGHRKAVSTLLERGGTPKEMTLSSSEALRAAAARGHTSVIGAVLTKRPDVVNEADGDGWTALCHAAAAAHSAAAKFLLQRGAEADWRTRRDRPKGGSGGAASPLILAVASRGSLDERRATAETLLELGPASVDLQDSAGCTALHYAARAGNGSAVELLLLYGADPSQRDGEGRVASDLAAAAPCSADASARMLRLLKAADGKRQVEEEKLLRMQAQRTVTVTAACQCPYDCPEHPVPVPSADLEP